MNPALEWADPRLYAATLSQERDLVLLYSGMLPGRYSLLAWQIIDKSESLKDLKAHLSKSGGRFENCWFGYLGYGLRREFENLQKSPASKINLPDLLMMRFKNILLFDHVKKTVSFVYGGSEISPGALPRNTELGAPELQSNMSDEEYQTKVKFIIQKIKAGDLYQCNLTRKFFGRFKEKPNGFALFCQFSEISPAPYSAYLKFEGTEIISASPEKFLTVENGVATTTPIKGTLSAGRPAAELANSEKDKAENLMIVDLMRNDLSRSCANVQVTKLYEITSYAKYHHMSSTITGKVKTNALDIAEKCFPPGSMTGAPKIQAIKLAAELENIERGVYSGAIGYFDGNIACDLAVVIRTLIINGHDFEFQVGSGIVADSTPAKELEEIYVKASAIFEILNLRRPRALP